ncbi:hypothetical protein ILYODFUR_025170 [Ilyodon furcidens]|uniref:Uncharacterized protein n=1 Tax=Ilyodon furcidens TaxID=33524 RepID=A0ABV0TY35_9TELE
MCPENFNEPKQRWKEEWNRTSPQSCEGLIGVSTSFSLRVPNFSTQSFPILVSSMSHFLYFFSEKQQKNENIWSIFLNKFVCLKNQNQLHSPCFCTKSRKQGLWFHFALNEDI